MSEDEGIVPDLTGYTFDLVLNENFEVVDLVGRYEAESVPDGDGKP